MNLESAAIYPQMTPIAQMERGQGLGSGPARDSPCGGKAIPVQVPADLRHLRHLRFQLPFPG